jgi:hypothetical protein
MDVVVWLRSLGLDRYEAAFRDNEIDERVLARLTQEDLKEIGVGLRFKAYFRRAFSLPGVHHPNHIAPEKQQRLSA